MSAKRSAFSPCSYFTDSTEKDKLYFFQKSCNFSQFHTGQAQVAISDTQLQVPLKILGGEKTTSSLSEDSAIHIDGSHQFIDGISSVNTHFP